MRFLSIILLILSLPASALGATFTLWDQFPISQGANNFYAYGYQYDGSPPVYREIAKKVDYAYWTTDQGYGIPILDRVDYGAWIMMHPTYDYGTIYGHEDAVLAWKPGNTVAYELDISGSFEGGGNVPYAVVYIRKDTEVLWSSGLSGRNNVPFTLTNKMLNPGETLYFGINNGNNSEISDGSFLAGTITYNAVPAPSALILMLSGLGGLWGWRRFK